MKIIFINSHPIQYFAPLYEYLNKQGLSVACWYCSDENVKGHHDQQFGVRVNWDIPILRGYKFRFFKNQSWKPSIYKGFFGLFNPTLIKALVKEPKSIVVVHGWAYLTHILVLIFARLLGHYVCLRGESPLNQELKKNRIVILLKQLLLRYFLFSWAHKFLYIGKENKDFYLYYKVSKTKLAFAPYAVDNQRFQNEAAKYLVEKLTLRKELGLPEQARIILFAAKYIDKKRPLDLLRAFAMLDNENLCLVMVGEGVLRLQIEKFIQDHSLKSVFLTGFKNQSEIGKYYAIADLFVLCSGDGETWGLAVNEALNFNLPIVATNTAGCSSDLVLEGKNGFRTQEGDINDLAKKITMALQLNSSNNEQVLKVFSFETIAETFRNLQSEIGIVRSSTIK